MFQWIVGVKDTYGFLDNTALLAIKLFDKFVSKNSLVQEEMHPLIAMTCLGLSVKIYEKCILDFEQCIQLCQRDFGYEYQTEMFVQAEFQIFK